LHNAFRESLESGRDSELPPELEWIELERKAPSRVEAVYPIGVGRGGRKEFIDEVAWRLSDT